MNIHTQYYSFSVVVVCMYVLLQPSGRGSPQEDHS